MIRPIRIGVLLQPGNAPDYATWRSAVLHAEELGADLIFGWDHFHRPHMEDVNGPHWPAGARSPSAPRSGCW